MKNITAAFLAKILPATQVGRKKDGTFVARRGYFYRHGQTAESFLAGVEAVLKAQPLNYTILGSGDHWAAFRGGAPVARQSHFWVNFRVENNPK